MASFLDGGEDDVVDEDALGAFLLAQAVFRHCWGPLMFTWFQDDGW